ncbi:hypothetical protein COV04_01225 [Candidatus Uhrbacteria bacterium CG10_big_fil_rev_8_21_14_0_10_48_11]|uniref:Uncharacterized protein n=1 Tax=Candidatus Uhrbacteria bacterium CG10_big_fil_rev_8_21_14_0_10_48_11 TaxID=1975037 RepID=A0A2M8LFA8_9BACT|nr:MAG: hypothetical protein COV04_01225 [Candidatus Uhrbacteria bacterium CG10_big_fil_rev_8_21_14_0_10_48_11]
MEHHNSNSIKLSQRILDKITQGEVTMRPRWHFVLKSGLLLTGIALLVLTIIFIVSLGFFVLHLSGVWFVPAFGWGGLGTFLRSLPWLLIGTALVFVGLLETLVSYYPFAYRRPLFFSAIGVVALVLVGGFFLAQTPIHRQLLLSAERGELPVGGDIYLGFGGQRFADVHRGVVTVVADEQFDMQTHNGGTIHVTVTPQTRFPFGLALETGDSVVVFGPLVQDSVQALGIGRIDSDGIQPQPFPYQRQIRFFQGRPSGPQ